MKEAFLLLVILSASLLLASAQVHAVPTPTERSSTHPAGARLAAGLSGQPSSPQPKYDEQLGMTFSEDFSNLSYNVTAVAQSDAQGFGPGYLLNGLTNTGYWYQVGVAFDWPYQGGGYEAGFGFLYEAFNSSGASVYPSGGGGGLGNFSGVVNNGDLVLLRLSLSNGQVYFQARDWNTGAVAIQTFPASGSKFVGLRSSSGPNGFFSGLMTEWYHDDPYYGSEADVTYSNPTTRLTSATLWVDEFDANTSTSIFESSQDFAFSGPDQLRPFSLDGATEYASAYTFITGSLGKTQITFSYSVIDGGADFGAPQLDYIENGTLQTAVLTGTPTTYLADTGSLWQVSLSLPGSSATERWETPQPTNGTATMPVNESVSFFHQYLCTLAYTLSGGGSVPSPPLWSETSFGSPLSLNGNASTWVDAGSPLGFPQILAGSTGFERWATQSSNLTITGSQSVHVVYYHQVELSFVYDVKGGGATTGPTLNATRFGAQFLEPISNSSVSFLDVGTNWTLSSLLPGSGAQGRWFASEGTSGNVTRPQTVTVVYERQYAVTAGSDPVAGGFVSLASPWGTAGSSVELTEHPVAGWKFEGWVGSGNGSYSGPLATAIVVVSGPTSENATFYPGLSITAGPNGVVDYAVGTTNGTVPAGGSVNIFPPLGSTVTLRAVASSALYTFAGWSPSGGGAALSLTVTSPETVAADFKLNPLPTIAVASILLVVVAGASFLIWRRRRPFEPPPAFNPPSRTPQQASVFWR